MVLLSDVSKMIKIFFKFFWLYISYVFLREGYAYIVEHKKSPRWIGEYDFETSSSIYYIAGIPYVIIGFYIFIFVLKSFFNKK